MLTKPNRLRAYIALLVIPVFFLTSQVIAQSSSANRPFITQWQGSLWYNSIDGIQPGVRFLFMQDDGLSGRYRVNSALWLNTNFPDVPVAYRITAEHPWQQLSNYQEEFTLQLGSSLAGGHIRHFAGVQKRLVAGLSDDDFLKIGIRGIYYKQFDSDYLVFPANWSDESSITAHAIVRYRRALWGGMQQVQLKSWVPVDGLAHTSQVSVSLHQPLSNWLTVALVAGSNFQSDTNERPEFGINLAADYAFNWFESPFFRSHGSLPVAGVRSGVFSRYHDGPILRGYISEDLRRFQAGQTSVIRQFHAISTEFILANPLDRWLASIPIAGNFVHFHSRLFVDAGLVRYSNNYASPIGDILANAGPSLLFNFNLPDYLGNERGFTLRWDVPLWVSDPPQGESSIAFRNQFSFDLIIPF